MSEIQCYLLNLKTKQRIDLPHKTLVVLGRNRLTNIKDTTISRKQIICCFNKRELLVQIKPVGQSPSTCNGLALIKDRIYILEYKDIIAFNNNKYQVIFDPYEIPKFSSASSSEEPSNESAAKRQKLDFPIFNVQKQKPGQNHSSSETSIDGTWEEIDNRDLLIYTPSNIESRNKIAAFDIDGTIIKTKSGARFPKTPDDWTWNISDVKNQLKKLADDSYKLVFFTNQSGVGNDSSRIKGFKKKVEDIIKGLNVPVQVFVALGKKNYRKPRTGMWDTLVRKNDGVDIDMHNSFYVGDAAGREKNWAPKRNKDHSCADRLFAINLGIKFYTPEEYFLKQAPAPFKMPEFDPRVDTTHVKFPDISYDKLNVILMVGGPGSGKSFFVKDMLLPKGYSHVSRDALGAWQKCVIVMEDELRKGKNVVIDNTNVDKETRQRFIDAAKKCGADVRCFVMQATLEQMRHNNKFREMTDKSHAVVSDIIIFSYRKNYQEPDISEGFTQILTIPFKITFTDKSLEKLYKTFLID